MRKIICAAALSLALSGPVFPAEPVAPSSAPCGAMALVPAGEFLMGSDRKDFRNETPRHRVYLDAFCIDRYEVSAADFKAFALASKLPVPKQPRTAPEKYPALYVGWEAARAYCAARGKALPTEAQWEKAAGGGSAGAFCYGDEPGRLKDYGWFWSNSGQAVNQSGLKLPNAYGVYDMHGNAQEWVADWYAEDYYSAAPASNPKGPESGTQRVVKGGSAFVTADLCRSAVRLRSVPETRYSARGFRCAAAPAVP